MIPQLKAKLREERLHFDIPQSVDAFDHAVNILMPVIEKLVEQRDLYPSYDYSDPACDQVIERDNQEILKLLEEK